MPVHPAFAINITLETAFCWSATAIKTLSAQTERLSDYAKLKNSGDLRNYD